MTAVLILLGLVVTGVWIWKRIPLETQDAFIEGAIPIALIAIGLLVGLWWIFRSVRQWRQRRARLSRLIAALERQTAPEKRLELAFAIVEVNGYRPVGLEAVASALQELFVATLKRAPDEKLHRIRGMAASHLGVLRDKASLPWLLAALEDDHAYVRACAALGLGRMRATEAREKLTKVMGEDWDQTVRSRAKEALERIG